MSIPRFKKGQVVGFREWHLAHGNFAVIKDIWFSTEWKVLNNKPGWLYKTDLYPWTCELSLYPYDPPASWEDEDMVWKPEGYEQETTDKEPIETA